MPRMLLARLLIVATLALPALLGWSSAAATARAEQCFPETSQCVQGRFLEYWQQNGGLARNGYPLTPERREYLEDGREYTVQYFERIRLELHPENAAPYDVLLGQFGRRLVNESVQTPPVADSARQDPLPRDRPLCRRGVSCLLAG